MSVLNLNIDKAAGPGRRALSLDIDFVREINEADLALLSSQSAGSVAPPLKRITDRHHSLARLLAGGMTEGEAALVLGYDISRVSILKSSPAFIELLALYRMEVDREFATNLEHMAGLSKDALLELRGRLEDEPENFSVRELLSIATEMQDRAGGEDPTKGLPTQIELIAYVADEKAEAEE
jgi:hypothetical protein